MSPSFPLRIAPVHLCPPCDRVWFHCSSQLRPLTKACSQSVPRCVFPKCLLTFCARWDQTLMTRVVQKRQATTLPKGPTGHHPCLNLSSEAHAQTPSVKCTHPPMPTQTLKFSSRCIALYRVPAGLLQLRCFAPLPCRRFHSSATSSHLWPALSPDDCSPPAPAVTAYEHTDPALSLHYASVSGGCALRSVAD